MKVLIIGLGSIAFKHINALRQIDPQVVVYALRSNKSAATYNKISNIYSFEEIPIDLDFVIISNPTSQHFRTIEKAINLRVPLFIEKPPIDKKADSQSVLELVSNSGVTNYTAFNLRFHPIIGWLKETLSHKRIIEVQVYCGSYLPDWRPGKDYRNIYSAKKDEGGGVHLDLIHELDYVLWLFGKPQHVMSKFSKKSDLKIDSIDLAHYWLDYSDKSVSIILNYFRRDPKRVIEIVMDDTTWYADLLLGNVINTKQETIVKFNYSITDTYLEQMKYFVQCLKNKVKPMNDLEESLKTLNLCLHDA